MTTTPPLRRNGNDRRPYPSPQITLPAEVLEQARTFFENCGSLGLEGTAMIKQGGITHLVVPDQHPVSSSRGGVSVEVTTAGQMQLARTLGPDECYVARIHSHPGEAYHSATDDANPVLTYRGALSIVVPYYGLGLRRGLDACAVLRHDGSGWFNLPPGPARDQVISIEQGQA